MSELTAKGLAWVLLALAAFVAWAAVGLVRGASGLQQDYAVTLGVFAAGVCIHALWYLHRVATERRGWLGGWLGASVSYALALIALFAVLVVAAAHTS